MNPTQFLLNESQSEHDRDLLHSIVSSCVKNSAWNLVSGGQGSNYFDVDELAAGRRRDGSYDPSAASARARKFADSLVERINVMVHDEPRVDRLAFIERDTGPIGLITYKDHIGIQAGIETCSIRPRKRLYAAMIKGRPIRPSESVALVSDVATTGNSILEAAEKVWHFKGNVPYAIVAYDRESGAREMLAQYGITLLALLTPESTNQNAALVDTNVEERPVMRWLSVGRTY